MKNRNIKLAAAVVFCAVSLVSINAYQKQVADKESQHQHMLQLEEERYAQIVRKEKTRRDKMQEITDRQPAHLAVHTDGLPNCTCFMCAEMRRLAKMEETPRVITSLGDAR